MTFKPRFTFTEIAKYSDFMNFSDMAESAAKDLEKQMIENYKKSILHLANLTKD